MALAKRLLDILDDIDVGELVRLLEDLISIPSPTGEEKEIAQYISHYASNENFTSIRMSDHSDVVANIDGVAEGHRLLFLIHTDHSKPIHADTAYSPKILDGERFGKSGKVIVGKGSCSPKGSIAAMFYMGKILASRRRELKGNLIIAAVGRDLLANHDGIREVAEKRWVNADMAIVGEATGNQPMIGARGINHIAIDISGIPTHRGRPEEGINPIWTVEKILGVLKEIVEESPSHPLLKRATLTPIDIRCEVVPPRTPHSCCLLLDRRTLPGEDANTIIWRIKEKLDLLKLEKQEVRVELVKQMYPFEGSHESYISRKIMEINEAITGHHLPFGYLSFATNGGFLTGKMKIPSVAYGPGSMEDVIPEEHVEIESILTATKVYAGTAFEVLQDHG